MAKSYKKSRTQKRKRSMKGGSAWQYTQSVYGGPSEQHAVSGSNVIAMNQSGGKRKRRGIKRGGSSAWVNAQSVYGGPDQQQAVGQMPSGNTSNEIVMNQLGGADLQPAGYNEQAPLSQQAYAVINANTACNATSIVGGSKGGSFLSELAVPAALLIGNEFAKNKRKSFNFTVKSNGKNKILNKKNSRRTISMSRRR